MGDTADIVRRLAKGAGDAIYEVVAGERSWQAAKLASLSDYSLHPAGADRSGSGCGCAHREHPTRWRGLKGAWGIEEVAFGEAGALRRGTSAWNNPRDDLLHNQQVSRKATP